MHWVCPKCTFENNDIITYCELCGHDKRNNAITQLPSRPSSSSSSSQQPSRQHPSQPPSRPPSSSSQQPSRQHPSQPPSQHPSRPPTSSQPSRQHPSQPSRPPTSSSLKQQYFDDLYKNAYKEYKIFPQGEGTGVCTSFSLLYGYYIIKKNHIGLNELYVENIHLKNNKSVDLLKEMQEAGRLVDDGDTWFGFAADAIRVINFIKKSLLKESKLDENVYLGEIQYDFTEKGDFLASITMADNGIQGKTICLVKLNNIYLYIYINIILFITIYALLTSLT